MSSKSPISVFVPTIVCSLVSWVITVHFFSQEDLCAIITCPLAISFSVGICVFGAGLILRDTIRQRGMHGINFKRVVCPQCGTHLRRGITWPSWKECWYSGWTCHECGLELNQYGRPWKEQNTLAKWAVLRTVGSAGERKQKSQPRDERIRTVNDQTQRGDAS